MHKHTNCKCGHTYSQHDMYSEDYVRVPSQKCQGHIGTETCSCLLFRASKRSPTVTLTMPGVVHCSSFIRTEHGVRSCNAKLQSDGDCPIGHQHIDASHITPIRIVN